MSFWSVWAKPRSQLFEPIMPELLRGIIMEFLGSLLFLFTGVGAVVFSCNTSQTLSAGGQATATCSLDESRVVVIA